MGHIRRIVLAIVLGLAVVATAAAVKALANPIASPRALQRMERVRNQYQKIAAGGGWKKLPPDLTLAEGARSPEVITLKQRLIAGGDLRPSSWLDRFFDIFHRDRSDDLYDPATRQAVWHFQERHGLKPDGVLGHETVQALNVPVEARLRQIEINLARMRALTRVQSERSIWVNIPEFRLRALDARNRLVLACRVVVGDEFTPTPVFSEKMTYVEFRPYWNIPKKIAVEEIVPKIEDDPDYLEAKGIEVVDRSGEEPLLVQAEDIDWADFADSSYDLRERPGPRNPLGTIKFMFPNRYEVYLHDTPGDSLFKAEEPTFSHGCIRVEKPVELAEFVLNGSPQWTPEKIRRAMSDTASSTVKLPAPIPVHIVYWTAWVETDGLLQFRDDVYGLDRGAPGSAIPVVSPEHPVGLAALIPIPAPAMAEPAPRSEPAHLPELIPLPDPVPFRVRFRDVESPYRVTGVFVLPGENVAIEAVSAADSGDFLLESRTGRTLRLAPNRWRWNAPIAPGLYPMRIFDAARRDSSLLNVFVMTPSSRLEGELLNGYRIGRYPPPAANRPPVYEPPRGFIEITPETEDVLLSPHFMLKQFACKQPHSHPQYVVLKEELVLRLEDILERLNQAGHPAKSLHVMSGYRTPYYNHSIGNVSLSAHQFGLAADIFVDSDGDDRMDDLTGDGKIDEQDASILYRIIDEVPSGGAGGGRPQPLGGLARYPATAAHGPFVHVDVRGVRARWDP